MNVQGAETCTHKLTHNTADNFIYRPHTSSFCVDGDLLFRHGHGVQDTNFALMRFWRTAKATFFRHEWTSTPET
jgi:hypothetical protein